MPLNRPLRILVVDDEELVRVFFHDFLEQRGHLPRACASAAEALTIIEKEEFDLAISDIRMPGMDGLQFLAAVRERRPDFCVVLVSAYGTVDSAIQALRLGAADFLRKPVRGDELVAVLERVTRLRRLEEERTQLRGAIGAIQRGATPQGGVLIGNSPAMAQVRESLQMAAASNCPSLLITGETGVGKEVAAREYHRLARAATDPFIAVSCPALPETLIESELFGHLKGAFTGAAVDRLGAFELAHGGTLFLDEIGDLSPAAQAKILRAIETRTVHRVGGTYERAVDIRLVAATHQDLLKRSETGSFRSDLLYRLNVFHVSIPPLRERTEDIVPLARHFCSLATSQSRPAALTPDAEKALLRHDYPGNVRELRNTVERAVILARGEPIQAKHVQFAHATPVQPCAPAPARDAGGEPTRDEPPEAATLRATLEDCHWNRRTAAAKLGLTYDALLWRIRKYHIAEH
ncbi:MAG: hypothetical protein A3K19_04745 [Lentisphaerae bacterium RIFOXYB12_FULL_65_16]|nr:MAG: hypothetical protein A3K18_11485 [Lentisphaerae bacterium RIFOXYA12_64_32]OGV84039.1 MAG: hypothetical protein A3K19_04745 [Lentisphaerae bacterium RIFOXYB12_FULL_65_16]